MRNLPIIQFEHEAVAALNRNYEEGAAIENLGGTTAYSSLASLASRLDELAEQYRDADDPESAAVIERKAGDLWRAIRHMAACEGRVSITSFLHPNLLKCSNIT